MNKNNIKFSITKKVKKVLAVILFILFFAVAIKLLWFNPKPADAAWYSTSWSYRIKLTIDHTKVSSDQTNFPVYVNLANLGQFFFSHANSNGGDIRVTLGDGTTEVAREIISFNQSARTGEIYFQYTGTLSSTVDSGFYIYYGNSAASDYATNATYGANNVWDTNFKEVLHLNQTASGTAGEFKDSTSNANNLSDSGTASQRPTPTTGIAGTGQNFVSTSWQYLLDSSTTNLNNANSNRTLAFWYYVSSNPGSAQYLLCLEDSTYASHECARFDGSGNLKVGDTWDSPFTEWISTTVPAAGSWHYFVWTWNGTTNYLYVDGAQVATNTTAPFPTFAIAHLWLGAASSAASGTSDFNGNMDEVRLSSSARSGGWVTTEYNNINSPSTFIKSVSIEQTSAKQPVLMFHLDEGYGTTAYDAGPQANNGTLAGSTKPTWQTEDLCVLGKCLYFNGSTSSVTVANTVGNVQTVSFWVRPTTNSQTLLDLDGGTHYIDATSGTITAHGFTSPSVYVNGVLNAPLLANTWQVVEVTTGTAFNATSIKIGNVSTNYLNGFIDEFKLYDYVRSTSQINQDAMENSGTSGSSASYGTGTAYLTNGLVGYWRMDENTGTSATDSSGNGNTGTLTNSPTWTMGKYGSGVYFDPATTNKYVNVSSSTSLDNMGAFTLSAWINPAQLQDGTVIISKGSVIKFYVANVSSGLRTDFFMQCSGANPSSLSSASDNLSLTSWHNVVITWDGSGCLLSDIHIYIDGSPNTQHANSTNGSGSKLSDSGAALQIGNQNSGTLQFQGSVDEVRVYNRTLSPTEVQQLYNWAPPPIGRWQFDEGSGSAVNDSTGNWASVNWTGSGINHWVPGKYGYAGEFNGTDDLVEVGSISSKLNLVSTNPPSFTMSSWMRVESGITDGGGTRILSNGARFLTRPTFCSSTPCFGFQLENGSTITYTPANAVSYNTWYFVTGVYDQSTHNLSIYLNGALQSTTTAAAYDLTTFGPMDVTIGNNQYAFKGGIDDFMIYNYIRTPAQIVQDMNGGHPAPGSPVGSQYVWYKFDEGYGTTANNAGNGGSSLAGTITNGTWSMSGKLGKDLSFNGSSTIVTIPSLGSFTNATPSTVSIWVNASSLTGSHTIFSQSSASYYYDRGIYYNSANSRICAYDEDPAYGAYFACNNDPLTTGTWYHLVGVWDGTYVSLYLNGIFQTKTAVGSLSIGTANTGVFYLGKLLQNGTNYYYWSGYMDDFRFYNSALTSDQIKFLYNQGGGIVMGATSTDSTGNTASFAANRAYCPPGNTEGNCGTGDPSPVAEWNLDENTGTSTNDITGNANTGTLSGSSTPSWATGKMGSGLSFNGTTSYVTAGHASGLQITSNLSLSAWIKLNNNSTVQDIVSRNGAAGSYNYKLYVTGNGKLAMDVSSNGTALTSATGTTTLSTNTWYHVTGVYIPSTSITVYVNGVIDGVNTSSIPASINNTATANLDIGSENDGSNVPAVTLVQECTNSASSGNVVVTCSTTAGHLLVVSIQASAGPTTTYSVSDSGGNSYSSCCVHQTSSINNTGAIFYSLTTASNTSVTVTLSGTTAKSSLVSVQEFSGIQSTPFDTSANNASDTNSTSLSSGTTATTAQANELVAGYLGQTSATATFSSLTASWTWNAKHTGTAEVIYSGYKILSATGTESVSATSDTSQKWTSGIAAFKANAPSGNFFNGTIDNVRVFNYARTPSQVAWDFNNGKPNTWLRFDETSGTSANNSGTFGSGANGTLQGSAAFDTTAANCKYQNCVDLASTSQYVNTGSFSPLAATGTSVTKASWGGWYYLTSTANSLTLMEKATELQISTDSSGHPICSIYYSAAFHNATASSTSLGTSSWNQVLCTYDGSNIKTYVNGALTGTTAQTNTITTANSAAYFGRASGGTGNITGRLDEQYIFNYPLTQNQINLYYNQGSTVRYGQ